MSARILNPRPAWPSRLGRAALRQLGVHPDDAGADRPIDLRGCAALCIATNQGVLDVGVPTGVFASELTVPYYCFFDARMRVDVASCKGGLVPVEPLSMKPVLRTRDDDRMLADDELRAKLTSSLAITEIDFAAYDLVFLAGGWGAAFDLGQSEELGARMSRAHAAGRVLGGICHGPLGLLRVRRADGELLVKGRRLTAVTDRQVRQLGVTITPLHPESALRAAGARFESARHPLRDFLANHVVVDGDLVTGQNQNAGPMVARLMMQRVLEKRASVRTVAHSL
jgi:putative intracellular protease/amidase